MLLYFKREINDEEKYKKFQGKLCLLFDKLKDSIKKKKAHLKFLENLEQKRNQYDLKSEIWKANID